MKTIITVVLLIIVTTLNAQITINSSVSADELAKNIFGPGVTVSNVVLSSSANTFGLFANGNTTNLGLHSGVVLTTGTVNPIANPSSAFASHGGNPSPQISLLTNSFAYDVCKLEFDISPACSTIATTFVFGSEEYPEYESLARDAFAILVTGPNPAGGNYSNFNMAVVPNTTTAITTNNINSTTNSAYYIDNSASTTIVYDGITVPITVSLSVIPCRTYHVVLFVEDAYDPIYDSGVFIQHNDNTCPPPTVVVLSDTTICPTDTVMLFAQGGAEHYAWIPNTGFDFVNDSVILAHPAQTTMYIVTGFMGCDIAHGLQDVVTVTVLPAPQVVITPAHPEIEMWESVTLTASGAGSYVWFPSAETTASITVNPGETTWYTVIGTASDSIWPCKAEVVVMVEVISALYVPNAFTPNNDGINDEFIPQSIWADAEIEQYQFTIFDRWGNQVFSTNNFHIGWNGYIQGKRDIEQSVYVWSITVKLVGSSKRSYTGRVTLLR